MNIDDAIAHYLDALHVRNFAHRTIINRAHQLRWLKRFCEQRQPCITEIEVIGPDVLVEFQSWFYHEPTINGTARSVGNQNNVTSGVRDLFTHLKRAGFIVNDPGSALVYARKQRTLPRDVLTTKEAKRILEVVDTGTTTGYRDRTMLEVFYATGIRKQELLNLRIQDVNLEEELMRIEKGKGGHDRMVPLSRVACSFLETYLKAIRPEMIQSGRSRKITDRLFLSFTGKPLDRNTLSDLIKEYASKAKVKKHITCHSWRHTCATHLLKNRANLRHVQAILGHRSLATTERYLHLTITDLKEAHRKYHPREKGND